MAVHRAERREIHPASPLQIYLHDINDTPLLSADEERELAERVAKGDPYAREHMVKANLRLVVNIARGYLGKGLSLEDLIEEGNLGLMRAVEGFDGMMDTRFSTYASYWIKQSIRRAVMNNGKPIRLPAYMVSLLSKWKRADAYWPIGWAGRRRPMRSARCCGSPSGRSASWPRRSRSTICRRTARPLG